MSSALGLALLVGALGCSLVTSLSGLSGGAGDAGEEAAPAPSDGATMDAAVEGGDSAAPGKPFCASNAADLCADFDQGMRDLGWTSTDIRGDGDLELDTSRARSLPASLHASMGRKNNGSDNFQQLLKVWPGAGRPTTIDFDVFVEPITWQPSDQGFTISEIYFDKSDKIGVLLFLTRDNWRLLIRSSPDTEIVATSTFPMGAWTHVRFDADPKTVGGSVSGYLDDKLVLEKRDLVFAQDPSESRLWLGIGASSTPIPAIDVRYDNVVVKFR